MILNSLPERIDHRQFCLAIIRMKSNTEFRTVLNGIIFEYSIYLDGCCLNSTIEINHIETEVNKVVSL